MFRRLRDFSAYFVKKIFLFFNALWNYIFVSFYHEQLYVVKIISIVLYFFIYEFDKIKSKSCCLKSRNLIYIYSKNKEIITNKNGRFPTKCRLSTVQPTDNKGTTDLCLTLERGLSTKSFADKPPSSSLN